jgi:hypothetical protein
MPLEILFLETTAVPEVAAEKYEHSFTRNSAVLLPKSAR